MNLQHEFADASARDAHLPGWRYQLAVFANLTSAEQHTNLSEIIDRYLGAWSERDGDRRLAELRRCVTDDVEFRDAHGSTVGIDELAGHIGAAQQHLGDAPIARDGAPRHCQGTALCDWVVAGPDGKPAAAGSNVYELAADGRLRRVVGLWAPPA